MRRVVTVGGLVLSVLLISLCCAQGSTPDADRPSQTALTAAARVVTPVHGLTRLVDRAVRTPAPSPVPAIAVLGLGLLLATLLAPRSGRVDTSTPPVLRGPPAP